MKKVSIKILSILLVMTLILSAFPLTLVSHAESEDAELFSLINTDDSSLNSAVNRAKATGNWNEAKSELLRYYIDKFAGMSWIKPNTPADNSQHTAGLDMLTFSENFISRADVSPNCSWVDIPMNGAYNMIVLTTYKHSADTGILIGSKESGNAPKLSVTCTDNTSYTIPASGDTYVRATGKDVTTGNAASYSTTAWGKENPKELWVMHQSDTEKKMPYSNNEMRTYLYFDTSQLQGKTVNSVKLSVYAKTCNVSNSALSGSDSTLPLLAMAAYYKTWSEDTLTWNTIADANGFGHYSWDGLGGIVWNESYYGKTYSELHVPNEFANATSRFIEVSTLCQKGKYADAKRFLMRFIEQTYDVIKKGDGFPYGRDIEPANRALEIPYIYRELLINNALTPDENFLFLRWLYQNTQYIVKDKSKQIFTDGELKPNTGTNYYSNNRGAWHICGYYNSVGFFTEFTESADWDVLYKKRLEMVANSIIYPDGSYTEITLGYPTSVIGWFVNMVYIMDNLGYKSDTTDRFISRLIALTKYLMDCSFPNGILPRYGDGSGGDVKNSIKKIIEGVADDKSENMQNLIWYMSGGKQGVKPATAAVYKDAKIVTDRTGWGADDSMIFMNAKSGGYHTHRDALALLMFAYNRELLTDTGTNTYDNHAEPFKFQRLTSRSHNTVEIDSTAQPATSFMTNSADYGEDNINLYSNNQISNIRAYTLTNPTGTHYRNVTYLKSYGGLLLVSDSVVSKDKKSHTYTQNWHSAINSNPTVTNKLGDFSDNVWGYTSFVNGGNVMIAQATPNNDVNSGVTPSLQKGYDEKSGTGITQYFEFKQTGTGNVSYNTAIYPYIEKTKSIRTIKLSTNVKDSVASSFRLQFFKGATLNTVDDEVVYYNSFETNPSTRTVFRRIDKDGYRQNYETNALNSVYHVRNNETIDMLSLSNGSNLTCFMSKSETATAKDGILLGKISTSAPVTDISAQYSNGVVTIDTSDEGIINRTVSTEISFMQMGDVDKVVLNGVTLKNGVNVRIDGKRIILESNNLFIDFKNDKQAVDRYSQAQYGGYNFDIGNWAYNSSRNGKPEFNSENEGTMKQTVISGNGYSGFENSYAQMSANTALGRGSECLNFDISKADYIQLRLKLENCVPTTNTNAVVIVANQYENNDFKWVYCKTQKFTFTDGEYTVLNIPVTDAVRALGNIITLRVVVNNFAQKSTSQPSYIYYDYIYAGPQEYSPSPQLQTISFYSEGEKVATRSVTYGKGYGDMPEVTKTGYSFAGWYTEPNGGELISSDTTVSVKSDQNLYSHWSANSYRVLFDNEFDFDEWLAMWRARFPSAGDGTNAGVTRGVSTVNEEQRSVSLTVTDRDAYTITYGTQADNYTMLLTPGEKYVLTFETDCPNDDGCIVTPYIFYYSKNAPNFDGGTSYVGYPVPKGKGTFSMEFKVPEKYNYVGIRFSLTNLGTSITVSNIIIQHESIFANGSYADGINLGGVNKTTTKRSYKDGLVASYTAGTDCYIEKNLTDRIQMKTFDSAYGELPTPQRDGYFFEGWYTEPDGGELITAESIMNSAGPKHLYSHWYSYLLESDVATVDTDRKLIYGFQQGIKSLDGYVKLTDSSYSLVYNGKSDFITTGTKIDVVKNGMVYESYTTVLFGDVNGDGWYDGMDAVLVNLIANGMLTKDQVNEAVWTASDCNHDGIIDEFDVEILQQAGLLLAKVDQTKSRDELQTDSNYVEYLNIIDQAVEMNISEDVNENEPTYEKIDLFTWLLNFIVRIFNYIKLHFAIIK